MRDFEIKNEHFDRLFNDAGLKWLGQNTNHFSPHPAVTRAMLEVIEQERYHAYAPPAGIDALRRLVLRDLGLEDASVLVTDGAIEGLYHACRTLCGAGDRFLATDPGWRWPMAFARASGAEAIELPIYEGEQGYRLTPEQLAEAAGRGARLIYLVDPHNPVGFAYEREEIAAFADIARAAGAYLIHDCTYRHFADRHTLAARFYPERTLTTYSFSKWLGLAGLRVGAVAARPDLIERLAEAPPNNLGCSVLAQRAAIAGLETKHEWFPEVQRRQRANQARIRAAAEAVPGFEVPVYPSQGNFLVVDVSASGVAPEALCEAYLRRGIMIRQAGYHTERYASRFVKISTTVPEEWVEAFCTLLPALVEEAAGAATAARLF